MNLMFFAASMGSPPHMRGKARKFSGLVANNGITPAHAGKSPADCRYCARDWDHPRTCGEKGRAAASLNCDVGSPPHMRGKGCTGSVNASDHGITPAHAGKSIYIGGGKALPRDHPRTCGEKDKNGKIHYMGLGSPPHMRGKGDKVFIEYYRVGITPAHAGKSFR